MPCSTEKPQVRALDGPVTLSAERPIVFIASTDGVKRDNASIDQTGWDLANYLKNPVILWNHETGEPPCARAKRVWVEGDKLMVEVEFDESEDGQELETKVRNGFINTVSVRWAPIEWDYAGEGGTLRYLKQELLEISLVAVPADPDAMVVSRSIGENTARADQTRNDTMSKEIIDAVLEAVNTGMAKVDAKVGEMAKKVEALEQRANEPKTDATRNLAPAVIHGANRSLKGRDERNDERTKDVRGLDMARVALADAYSKFVRPGMPVVDAMDALGYRKTAEKYEQSRAAATGNIEGTASAGGYTVPVQFYQGVIDYLKENVVIRNAIVPGAQQIQMTGESIDIPKVSSGLTFNWVSNSESAPGQNPSAMVFGQMNIAAKTGFAECVISRDLLEDSVVNVEQIVRDELLYSAAKAEDLALIEGTGLGGQPLGLMLLIDSSNTKTCTSSATIKTVLDDYADILGVLSTDKVQGIESAVFVLPAINKYLMMDLAATAGGGENFPLVSGLNNGMLFSHKAVFSDVLTATVACCVVPRYLWFAEKLAGQVEADDKYLDSSGVTHAASARRQIVLRLWRKFGFAMSQNKAGCLIVTPANWD